MFGLTRASLALIVALATVTLLAQTHPSTPAEALKALIDAIEREDVDEVGELIDVPLKLDNDELALLSRRYILGSKLFWLLEEKFGELEPQRIARVAHLDYVPRLNADQVKWDTFQVGHARDPHGVREGALGVSPDTQRRVVRMVKTERGWKVMLNDGIAAMVVLNVQDAPWRNRIIQQVTDGLKAGMLATKEQVIDELIPRAPPQTEPVKVDRGTPAGAILVAAEAIENGDVETFADSFEMIGGDDDGVFRRMAEQAILERKVEKLIRAKYLPDQAERIIRDSALRRKPLGMYESVEGWVVDGDVARGALKEQWYDVVRRMVRRDGVWRIQYPPRSTIGSLNDPDEKLRQAARMKTLQEVLDHPERFATAGDMLEALDPSRQELAAQQVDAGAAARQQLEQIKQELAKNPPQTPQEADEQALGLSLWELGTAVASKDAKEAARHYFVEADDGSYALARQNRLLATMELCHAASREIDSSAGALAYEFDLANVADDIYGLLMLELKIQGDRAVPTAAAPEDEWIPPIQKIAGQWKIDVTAETGGDPKAAANRAEDETSKLQELTMQVKAGKFSNLDQLRQAMKDAGIKGSPVTRQ